MEGISAGASVIAFIGLALESAKALHNVVTGFDNARRETAAVTVAVGNLQLILTQLRDCKAFTDTTIDLQDVRNLVDACNKDVTSFEKDLSKVQCIPKATKFQQTWKKVKATFLEKSFNGMWNKLNHHCTVLQFQLNLLHSHATQDCKTQLHGLQATVTAANMHVSTLDDNMQNMGVSLEELIRSATASVAHAVGLASGATTTRLDNISVLLKALQNQVSVAPVQLDLSLKHQALSQEGDLPPPELEELSMNPKLIECLTRLSRLRSREQDSIHDDEAETIIDDLECLLNALAELQEKNETGPPKKRKADYDADATVGHRDLKRLCGLVVAASAVDVNQGPKRLRGIAAGKIVQKSKTMELALPGCTATVRINKRTFHSPHVFSEHAQHPKQPYTEEIHASVKAIVGDGCSKTVILAYIRQVKLQHSFSALNPVISMSRVMPDDSPIFKIVLSGDVHELRKFVARGNGSLRDRDSRGTPLLHYAVCDHKGNSKYDMCKFLIENGADVDETAPNPYSGSHHSSDPLTAILSSPWGGEREEVDLTGLLLAVGADPTYATVTRCVFTSYDLWRLILDNPIPFLDLEEKNYYGETILLQMCSHSLIGISESIFDLLLAKGAKVHARDHRGKNCLRLLLEANLHIYGFKIPDCLILLIKRGADAFSVDNDGISVSDYAYRFRHGKNTSSRLGDLWDAALSSCGYDIRHMRKASHRVATYGTTDELSDGYERTDFELLWKGREELCPYYDDPPVWCPYSMFRSGECPFGETGIACPGPEGVKDERPCNCWACFQEARESAYTEDVTDEEASDGQASDDESYLEDDEAAGNEERPDGIASIGTGRSHEEDEKLGPGQRVREAEAWETEDMYGGDHVAIEE